MTLLQNITSPEDVKALPAEALPTLCSEIRQAIVESSAAIGGHVGSNLAVVELAVALHRVFDSPADKIVWDVSHQAYAHKMLTGRAACFIDPARYEEVSGFTNPAESEHDHFCMGHTSTSVSLACGLAKARDLLGQTHDVVAVIGDGSLSGGLAFEGLDNAAEQGGNLIVVVNDNEWSIAPNAGGIYRNLAELRAGKGHAENNLFEAMGLEYRYLEDGHDVAALEAALAELRGIDHPVVLHVHTRKGKGFSPAEADPQGWHHVGPFDVATGEKACAHEAACEDYAEITGAFLETRMASDQALVAISAATPYIMGFGPSRRERVGTRLVDVGIAEEHAVTYATALAAGGAHPVLGIYGSFLQRAYDEVWHDLCLNGAGATILVFGSSAFGTTDATHLGFFDIAMLGGMPGLTYLAPTCAEEYLDMLGWSVSREHGPVAIRVPGAGVTHEPSYVAGKDFSLTRFEVTKMPADPTVAVLALGSAYALGESCVEALAASGVNAALVNPRFATTCDEACLARLTDAGVRTFVTLEDGVADGGFGARVAAALAARTDVRVRVLGLPREFRDRYDAVELLAECGMTVESVVNWVRNG